MSLNGSYGGGKAERLISSAGTDYVAKSRPSTLALASRLRAGVLAKAGQFDVIPSVELDLAVLQDGGFTETGAGSLNLKVHRKTHFLADVRPALRLSTDHPFAGGIARGYVEAGARIALNGLQHTVSLPGSPSRTRSCALI
ncbi:autotransporter domain-containing protein [Pannonibacter sp. Pt2-lr]